MIVSTHCCTSAICVRETLDICTRAYILNNGKVIAQGGAQEILTDQEVIKVYLGEDFYI